MTGPTEDVRMVVREEFADGDVAETVYVAVSVDATVDAHVKSRMQASDPAVSDEIITEYRAAPTRPVTYPANLPFVPERPVWTTESPSGAGKTGARWLCADADSVVASIVASSAADGWRPNTAPHLTRFLNDATVVLVRGAFVRAVHVVPLDGQHLVQLWDMPISPG